MALSGKTSAPGSLNPSLPGTWKSRIIPLNMSALGLAWLPLDVLYDMPRFLCAAELKSPSWARAQ